MGYAHSWQGGGGYGTDASAQTIDELYDLNVRWIALTPFGYQQALHDTKVGTIFDRSGHETDASMARDVSKAHEMGIQVMLKPHLWIRGGDWPGYIEFEKEEDWSAWMDSYSEMILHYAEFAERNEVASLSMGCELKGLSSGRADDWRALVEKIRAVYSGQLLYSANWDEYAAIPWWDALDAVGINAYFPLSTQPDPKPEDLAAGAERVHATLAKFHGSVKKPIIFTEIGFRPAAGAAAKPWEHGPPDPGQLDLQRRCYEAIHQTFAEAEWLEGVYWWKWFSGAAAGPGRHLYDGFTPRGRPAQDVMVRWFAKNLPEVK